MPKTDPLRSLLVPLRLVAETGLLIVVLVRFVGPVVLGVLGVGGCSRPGEIPPATETPAASLATSAEPAISEAEAEAAGASIAGSFAASAGATALCAVDPDALTAQLRAANPSFQGTAIVERQGGDVVVAVNDPAVTDISPLAGLRINKLDLFQCGVEDLTPLKGLPLTALAIDRSRVVDLRPLQGMPLEYLSASETGLEDLTPLRGCPLRQLNLVRTKVRDLSPLAGCPLQSLWLNDTPVQDVSPLASTPLESLTLAGTAVEDLRPLKGMPLKRLHIARTPVKDLSPLRWLMLERLVFTPSRIENGLDVIRGMPGLREIGTAFGESDWGIEDRLYPPGEFWELLDQGKLAE